MAFQIKDFLSIVASMVNWMRATQTKVTDFNVGSVARTLVEAPAIEIDQLYQQMLTGLREAIPVSVFNSFNFDAIPATPAGGMVTVTITSSADPVVIPAGTRFKRTDAEVYYRTVVDVTIDAGDTAMDVSVSAEVAGTIGNCASGQSFVLSPSPPGFISATNAAAFQPGTDEETDDQRKTRFQAYIQSLARGTNHALAYGLKTVALYNANGVMTERVAVAQVTEPWLTDPLEPIAYVKCYVHNGIGSTSPALVARAKEVIEGYIDPNGAKVPGWKAAGVKVDVLAATETGVAVTGTLTPVAGYDAAALIAEAEAAIAEYITLLEIGEPALKAEMVARVMAIEGVKNIVLSVPSGDTAAGVGVKLMPGTLMLTPA